MTLEEKILAYLDGSLDAESSEELLHSLSTSPEKRAVLEEHLQLKNMFALGQKPFSIPASAERSLAERIPALAARTEMPARLVRRSALSTHFAGVSGWFSGLAEQSTVRWSVGIASIAAIGMTAWLLSSQSVQNSPVSHHTTEIASSSSTAPAASGTVTRTSDIAQSQSIDRATREHTTRIVKHSAAPSIVLAPTNDSHTNGAPIVSATEDDSHTAIASVPVRDFERPNSNPQVLQPQALTPNVLRPTAMPRDLRVTLAFTSYQYQLPSVGTTTNVTLTRPEIGVSYDLSNAFALRLEGGSAIHPTYQVSSKNEHVTSIAGQSYSRIIYSTNVAGSEAYFTRLGFEYTVNRGDSYEVHVATTGGLQFANTMMPVVALSAGFTHPLTSLLSLDLSALLTGSWGTATADPTLVDIAATSSGPVGVVHNDVTSTSSFTPAFGVRAGLRYQF